MSTDPETTENEAPGAPEGEADAEAATEGDAGEAQKGEAQKGEAQKGEAPAPELTEAQAELAAQKVERERIERRKAEKDGPISSGGKLSGSAADLLAAVRAVESGAKPASAYVAPAPRSVPEAGPRPDAGSPNTATTPAADTGEARGNPDAARVAAGPAAGSESSLKTGPGAGGLALGVHPLAAPSAPAPETVAAVRGVLASGGAPEALASQVAVALGESAAQSLRDDPWQLLRVSGVRPEQADGFARALLGDACGPQDERRGRAVTLWLLEQAALAGHTALELPALTAALAQRGVPDADAAVQDTVAEGEALVFQDALEEPGAAPAQGDGDEEERPVRVLVGLERYALAEESLADGLARIVNALPGDGSPAWETAVSSAPRSAADLIRAVASNGLVLHTGGEASRAEPAALLDAAHALGLRAVAACHTPNGRDRFAALLSEGTGAGAGADTDTGASAGGIPHPGSPADDRVSPVVTLPGLLAGVEGPGRAPDGTLALDLLVVLDAPQLDVETAAMVVESLADGARLVLSGDPGVLWSAGAGRVFGDLVGARVCPQVASRTPDPGPIGELVSGVGIGELNQVEAPGKEIVIVPVRDAGEAVHRTVQLVADSVPRAFGVTPEETVVITPGHGGAAGTRALNAALKERINPGPGRFAGFDPGDLVAYSPAPGRTLPGRVTGADADGLHLTCAGAAVVVPKEQVERSVRHGWALTAHQAVGGRWPAAVVVLPGDAAQALSRPWVYTAFGRAQRHLSVVHGVEQALPRAVAEVLPKPRTTRLPVLLRGQVPAAVG
ncbi:ATP-binding domain-containing protein [Streptomyces roseirectus]|uniref:ATP-binding domain-containing protein n=1 Tax=Streptomyces roseirectus TaxID=2768066 RepID=A0A7H0ILH2_9ACTN|nr:helix-hairpin-helix domain-containing protein [Streptomyces roseirectus]QNP73638.1 ATP-binding domain-containing protein [Streptomyces roseirectus]